MLLTLFVVEQFIGLSVYHLNNLIYGLSVSLISTVFSLVGLVSLTVHLSVSLVDLNSLTV